MAGRLMKQGVVEAFLSNVVYVSASQTAAVGRDA